MKRIAIAAAAAVAMLSTAAQAQQTNYFYGEVGYTVMKIEGDGLPNVKPNALRGIVGYAYHPNLAMEGMLAFGVRDDSFNDAGVNVDVKLKNAWGIYLKPKFDVTPQLEVFGRLGATKTNIKATAAGVSESERKGDLSWGLGAAYRFNPRMSVGLDYMRYSDDTSRVDGVTLSLGYRF
jgi:opacity protein-like surface antigen